MNVIDDPMNPPDPVAVVLEAILEELRLIRIELQRMGRQ